ncbi:MAG TPA: hypothetical protein VNA12_05270 [Mycobacteriales bacterium]|nr:hypothetical protein [Mycobacteriales bacterium]
MGTRRTTAWIVAVCAVLGSSVVAHAAPKPCAPLAVDRRGDLEAGPLPDGPYAKGLDLLAVDLASTAQHLVVTVRVADGDAAPVAVPATVVDVLFEIGPVLYNAYRYVGPEGTIYGFNNTVGGHTVTGTSDRSGTVRIKVPRSLVAAKPGAVIGGLGADTYEMVGTNVVADGWMRDSAGSTRTYRYGARGCL